MINSIKGFFETNEYGTVKFIIVYVCEPLFYKTSEGSFTGVFLSEARLFGMEENIFVRMQEEVFINILFKWYK